jgi:hypothetical protein
MMLSGMLSADADTDGEAFDDDAQDLSHVGTACYDALRSQHQSLVPPFALECDIR